MEGRGREGVQLSSTNPTKPAGILALRNFTIPRKKRVSGQVLLEPCPEESRDYCLIQSKLREARLDMRKEHANDWLWNDVKLVHNEELLKEFSEKRSEMRSRGRHGREMEERFCFLVASHETTTQIYQHGLGTETQEHYSLGKPSHGVYLFKHVDVALKHAATSTLNGKSLIVFKVLIGKVKKVTPCLEWNRTPDPTVAFDCHMSRDAVSHRESLSQQVLGSFVFLFDYNENQELNKRPRQCLPYGVVSFVPAISAMPPTSISPPVSPVKHPNSLPHGPLEHLRGCTVAKRRGKGENATVTFKHFATQGCPETDYTSQTYGTDTTPVQYNELQNPFYFVPPSFMPLFHTAGYFSPSLPYVSSIPFQNNYPDESTFTSNEPTLGTTDIYGSNTDKCDLIPQTPAERISTVVYSSRLVKDPRLSRQETNIKRSSSEQEEASSVTECDEQRCQSHLQNQEEKNECTRNDSHEKQSLQAVEEESNGRLQDAPQECHTNPQKIKTENMPSIKLFKMKFQKYAAYLRMSDEERHKNIWSQEDLTPEQKQLLTDRIHFYETYYRKYKQGLLFQKDNETENALSSSNLEPKNNETSPSTPDKLKLMTQDNTVNQSHMTQSPSSNDSKLTSTTDLVNNEKAEVDASSSDINKVRHNGTESNSETEKALKDNELNSPTDSHTYLAEPQNGSEVQYMGEPGISEQSLKKGPLILNNSEKGEVIDSSADFEQQLCLSPSEQDKVNPHAVSEIKCSTIASDSTLSNNTEENQELEFHIIAMNVTNCVDISVVNVTECSDLPSATAMMPDQKSLSSTKNEDRESVTRSESGDSSEMSIEVKRGELRQDNTIHSDLYKRLQLEQLLPDLNGANPFSNKSYLCPKDLDKIPAINQPHNHLHETTSKEECSKTEKQNSESGEDLKIIVIRKSHQVSVTTEKLTLSERFSTLKHLQKKRRVIILKKKINDINTIPLNGDIKSDSDEDLSLSNGGEKETFNNVKLIQLLAQRFNAARSLANCRHLRRKCKVRNRRKIFSSALHLKHSAQLSSCGLRRTLHFKKKHLWKPMKKCKTKLGPNRTSQYHSLFSKSTSNPTTSTPPNTGTPHSYKGSTSCLDLSVSSQSPGLQSHDKLESSQEDISNISAENHSCPDTSISENNPSHDDGSGNITASKEKSTEDACKFVSAISRDDDIRKLQGAILHVKTTVMTDEMEPERGTNNICYEEKASPVTCPANNESNKDGKIAKAEDEGEATAQKKLSQANTKQGKDKHDTGEISTDNNVGAYEEKSKPVQVVSSTPDDITSGNVILSCTAKAQTAKATDLPRLMNNDVTDTGTETETLYDSSVEKAESSVSKSVMGLMANVSSARKTGDLEANVNAENLCNLANSADANDKFVSKAVASLVDQSSLKTLECAKENTNHPSEPASSSQCQPPVEHTKSSGVIDSHVKTTADLHSEPIKDAKGSGIVAMPGNLHPAWQGPDKDNVPSTSTETQLISKLRDYLTKFEFTVKRHESVNDSGKNAQVPMAWITLDSTIHKQQLLDQRHYNRLANLRNQGSNFVSIQKDHTLNYMLPSMTKEEITGKAHVQNSSVAPAKRKISKGRNPSKDYTSKGKGRNKLARVSPDSTSMLEIVQKDSHTHLVVNKDADQPQISTSVPNVQQWMQNHGSPVPQNPTVPSRFSEHLHGSSVIQPAEKATEVNERTLYDNKVKNIYVQEDYSVADISSTLKLADHAVSVAELISLQLKCKHMLHHFISNFERDQNTSFRLSCISRNLILEKYLDKPPAPVELKFEGLNSFLELQMMVEAFQFVENKINFLSRKATFRSLLWYDPSLYGELYKGAVGFQQQSSLFSSFQQCLASEGYSKLQEYYIAVSTLHQQLQDAPDTSYYMYLKSKRERLEIEAALRNHPDIKSFFLSVPVALMMNFGDSLESLEKTHHIVMTFVETPSDRLPGLFDVGKAEHLSIICRYLQEKVIFIKSSELTSKVSWFGLEHLLYDASKLLVWRESEHGMSNEVLAKYKRSNPQIVYGVTESGIALVNKIEQPAQPVERARIMPQQQMDGVRNYRNTQSETSTERVHGAMDAQTKDGVKEINQSARRRATHPPLRSTLDDSGAVPLVQPNLPGQLVRPTPYPDFSQRNSAVHWRMAVNHAWDWNPPSVVQPSKSHPEIRALLLSKRRVTLPCTEPRPDIQNSHTARKQQWSVPSFLNPRPVERNNQQSTSGPPHQAELRKELTNDTTAPVIQPLPLKCLPPDMTSVVPPPVSLPPFLNTSNQVIPHEISTPINYPYFVFNGQTYSTVAPSGPGSALHAETRYHPHPV